MLSDIAYAKIKDGVIVDYSLSQIEIKDKGGSVTDYTLVEFKPLPEIPEFHKAINEVNIYGKKVVNEWKIVEKTLDEFLYSLYNPGVLGFHQKEEIFSDDIPEKYLHHLSFLMKKYISDKLDVFSKIKSYDDMQSLSSYSNSTIPKFREEALYAIQLRDSCLAVVSEYLDKIYQGTIPIPVDTTELDEKLPELIW